MTVQQLIEKLSKMDPEKQVYITDDDNDLGYPFYHQCLGAYEINVEEEEIVKIVYRS